jgi:hypothetical protein
LVERLIDAAAAAKRDPMQLEADLIDHAKRKRRTNRNWRPESWGYFPMVFEALYARLSTGGNAMA